MNEIHPTAKIAEGVKMGDGNVIGANVIIGGFKDKSCDIEIGNGNIIHDNVRIMVDKLFLGNGNTIHNHVSVLGGDVTIGDGNWIGQYSALDGTGYLHIANRTCIGYNCHIWTHTGYPNMLKDCLLASKKQTVIGSSVWLMGCNIVVNPGVVMSYKSIALANSVITKSTRPYRVYGGIPARELDIEAWER